MRKIISFSLWGDAPRYVAGALENVRLARDLFPEWTCRFHCASTLERSVAERLASLGAEVVTYPVRRSPWEGLFRRFLAADGPDTVLVRDVDSRLSARERAAVDEWLASGKRFHSMRDHPYHARRILGGLWGARGGILEGIGRRIEAWPAQDRLGADQEFLSTEIWPLVVGDCLVHDEFVRPRDPDTRPFPSRREGWRFVGEVFDEHGAPDPRQWRALRRRVLFGWLWPRRARIA